MRWERVVQRISFFIRQHACHDAYTCMIIYVIIYIYYIYLMNYSMWSVYGIEHPHHLFFCILWSRYNRMFNQSSLFAITRLHSTKRLDYKLVRGVDLDNLKSNISHSIHVWYIYLHLVYLHLPSKSTKCMANLPVPMDESWVTPTGTRSKRGLAWLSRHVDLKAFVQREIEAWMEKLGRPLLGIGSSQVYIVC